MRSLSIVAIVLMAACVMATQADIDYIDALMKDDFGRTLIEALQVESEGGNLNKISNYLDSLKAETEKNAQQNAALAKERLKECKNALTAIEEVLTVAENKKADDERVLPNLKEVQEAKQEEAVDKAEEQQRNLDRIQVLIKERKEQRAEYEDHRDELVGQISALKEAKSLIENIGQSFLQESVVTELRDHHDHFMKAYPRQRGYHQMITFLLDLATDTGLKNQDGAVQVLVDIIDDLVESLYDVQNVELKTEDKRQNDFVISKTRLETQNAAITHQVASLKAEVLKIDQTIAELTNDIATQVQLIKAKQQQKADQTKICSEDQRTIESLGRQYASELSLINDVNQKIKQTDVKLYLAQLKVQA